MQRQVVMNAQRQFLYGRVGAERLCHAGSDYAKFYSFIFTRLQGKRRVNDVAECARSSRYLNSTNELQYLFEYP